MNRILKIALGMLIVAAVAGGSFYGGAVYGKGQASTAVPGAAGVPGGPGQAGVPPAGTNGGQTGGNQGGMLFGQIEAIGDGTLTMTDSSGNTVVVNVTDTTLIQKQASVTLADLQQGETVVVSGSAGSDGSITARMVQVSSGEGFSQPGANPASGAQGSGSAGTNP